MTEQEKFNNKVKNRSLDMDLVFKCRDCGNEVSIKLGEIFFMDDHGLCVKNRCPDCIKKKNEKFKGQ